MENDNSPDPNGHGNEIPLREFFEELVSVDVTFLAANEYRVQNDELILTIDAPPEARRKAIDYVDSVSWIKVDDATLPFRVYTTYDHHFHRRIPIFATGFEGLEEITLDRGIKNLEQALAGEWRLTPPPEEEVPLENLAQNLIDEGAQFIEVERELIDSPGIVELIVGGLPASQERQVAGQVKTVEIDDQTFPLASQSTWYGPNGGLYRIGLYYADSKELERGMADLTECLEDPSQQNPDYALEPMSADRFETEQ